MQYQKEKTNKFIDSNLHCKHISDKLLCDMYGIPGVEKQVDQIVLSENKWRPPLLVPLPKYSWRTNNLPSLT